NRAKGINGKKGVLWWEMYKIISKRKPKRILLENVDRLLNSPTSQRGRDFAIMIYSLNLIGYIVEWKVIKASDYGFPQKRKRVFIYAYRSKRKTNPSIKDISSNSIFELAFPSTNVGDITTKDISTLGDLSDITEKYDGGKFLDRGIAINGVILQTKQLPVFEGYLNTLNDIKDGKSKGYVYLNDDQIKRAAYMKASKKIPRIDKNTGFTYNYSEGRMDFPDSLQKPGRTMLTSEGTINRSTHFIKAGNKVRLITPLEAERMNGFPDGWTKTQPDRRRLFMMGNALVTGIVDKLAQEIQKKEGK
ncbi:MAG: DNA (cytosine-5-)-methyltransferase, partial [Mycoplasmataceae bacterium]|nr:DNA (cytosine-5-)-methyltransferase [Mycoplasmataceae bacterium]